MWIFFRTEVKSFWEIFVLDVESRKAETNIFAVRNAGLNV